MTGANLSPTTSPSDSLKRQVRGSVLLVGGRGVSIFLNLFTQIAIVRYLTRGEFGAWAYAISLVEAASVCAACCMDKTFSRFGAIYHERSDSRRLAGAFALSILVPISMTFLLLGAAIYWQQPLQRIMDIDTATARFLAVMACLVPLSALASVALSFLTVLQGARSVFLRKYLAAPAVKLILVLTMIYYHGPAMYIAGALVLAGIVGLLIDGWLVFRLLQREALLPMFKPGKILWPVRDFFRYALGLSSADFAFLARGTLIVLLLGWLGSTEQAGEFRVILPIVRLNELVLINFALLFVPLASRMWATSSPEELLKLYTKSRHWLIVLSFPVFALCVCCAGPLITLLFGSEWRTAAPLLVVMSGGYFLQTLFGYNGQLLKVMGCLRALIVADVVATVVSVVCAVMLIPVWQGYGAALSVVAGILVHCGYKHRALVTQLSETKQNSLSRSMFRSFEFKVLVVAMVLTIAAVFLQFELWQGLALTLSGTLLVLCFARGSLNLAELFPEIMRIPGLARMLPGPLLPVPQTSRLPREQGAADA